MDIFEVQSLIARRRILQPLTYDPTKAWLQVGLFQPGNRSNSASNANTYKSFAVRVSDLAGVSTPHLQNYLLVDGTYGNNLTAVKNDDEHPYQTIDAAIAAAGSFDVIIVNPGDYLTFSNVMRPGGVAGTITYYLRPRCRWTSINPTGGSGVADPGTNFAIYGKGNVTFGVSPFVVTGDYTGEIVIECDTLRFAFGSYLLLNNTTHLSARATPENLTIKCRVLQLNDVTGIMYALPWQVNITADRLESTIYGPGGVGICEIWQTWDYQNSAALPIPIKTVINIGNVIKDNAKGCMFMNIVGGNTLNENHVNANITQLPHGPQLAHMFRIQAASNSKVFYDGVATIVNSGMVYDQTGAQPFIQLKGKVYHSDTSASLLHTPYYIQSLKLELRNDTITSSINNSVIIQTYISVGAPPVIIGSQVDLVSAKIVNTDTSGVAPALIYKDGGADSKLRLRDSYLITGGQPCIKGNTPGGEPYEVYSGFAGYAPVNMTNVLATTLLIDSNMTDNNL